MKSGSLVRVVLAVGSVATLAVAAPGEADACGMAVFREIDDSAALVARSESTLGQADLALAATQATQAFPALKLIKPGTLPLADRALRVLALAAARSDGRIAPSARKAENEAERAANLEWSIETIRKLSTKRGDSPAYQTDLGEALARAPAHQNEAAKILGDLAERDLITSAEGYAALARLRAEQGDDRARDAAIKRCEVMTKTPKICDASAVAENAAKS